MKRVGIMSMQRVINYGSFLQAYGLKKTIENLGYSATFIDYKFEKSLVDNDKRYNNKKDLITKIKNNINIIEFFKKKTHLLKFRKTIEASLKKIGINEENNYSKEIDSIVIGSDEVFNCLQPYPVGYSRNLFGYEYENIDVISYAASFGYTTLNGLKQYGIAEEISNMLKKFKSISVRDVNSVEIVEKLTNSKPIINFDPVLISNFDAELKDNKIDEKYSNYIIIYAYTGRLLKVEEKYIRDFAKKHNKKIISLGFYQKIADYNLTPNPFETLNYIKNADYVITDTFHGTVFSSKMNTKFCTIIRDSNKNKLEYLLKCLDLSSRMVNSLNDIERLYNIEIDFTSTNSIIKKETEISKKYLKDNL